jgi:hypothetical protein
MAFARRGAWGAALLVCLTSWPALAQGFLIRARTEAQAYQLRSFRDSGPTDPVLLPRRRLVQYLGLDAFELVKGEDLSFSTNLRVFADFGLPRGEAARLDGVRSEDADLLDASVSYRSGGLSGRLGRQIYVDSMDLLAFDGLTLRYLGGAGVGAEVYGGLWVKGAGFFGSGVYQLDGTRESDERRLAADPAAPLGEPALAALQPLLGAKLLWENALGLGVSGSLGYRRAVAAGALAQVDLERAALELRYGTGRGGLSAFGGAELDLIQVGLSQLRAEARYDADAFAVSLELLRSSPVLSADSIWYWFATAPRDEANLRAELFISRLLRVYARATAHRLNDAIRRDGDLAAAAEAARRNAIGAGGSVGAELRGIHGHAAADLTGRAGPQGRSLWLDLNGGLGNRRLSRWTAEGRLSAAYLDDAFNPLLRGVFLGAQAWTSWAVTRTARASLVGEINGNRFTLLDAKLFALLELEARL